MSNPHRPSGVRVFGKSLHWLVAGWVMSVTWLWLAGVRQHIVRQGMMPDDLGLSTLLFGGSSALILGVLAVAVMRWTGPAPKLGLERREWHHAFWWAIFPNLLLLATAYLMIQAAV